MEILNNNSVVELGEDYVELPFAGSVEESFNFVQAILDENNLSNLKLKVLENISNVVDILVEHGNVHENLVLDTAQLFIMAKHSGINLDCAKDFFGKHSIAAAKLILNDFHTIEKNIKYLFENEDYPFIAKIKIADIIFELKNLKTKSARKNHLAFKEAEFILATYEQNFQKGLINQLKLIIE